MYAFRALWVVLLLVISGSAEAGLTKYTVDWNKIAGTVSGSATYGGVTITSNPVGVANGFGDSTRSKLWIYTGYTPDKPIIGHPDSTSDVQLNFSSPLTEFCWYAT